MKSIYTSFNLKALTLLLAIGSISLSAQTTTVSVDLWDSSNQPVISYPVWVNVGAPFNMTLSGHTNQNGVFADTIAVLTGPTTFTFMTYDCQGNRISSTKTLSPSPNWKGDTLTVSCSSTIPQLNPTFVTSANNLTVNFAAFPGAISLPPGTQLTYTWDFDDNNSGTGGMATHLYAQPGIYNVCLTVSAYDSIFNITSFTEVTCTTIVVGNAAGCQAFYTVSQNPGSNTFTFSDSSFTSNVPSNGFVRRYWDFGDGSSDSGTTVNHTYNAPGTYSVCLNVVVRDGNGNIMCSDTYCDSVTYNGTPNPITCNAQISYQQDSLQPHLFHFVNTGTINAGGAAYTSNSFWDFGDGDTAYGNSLSHAYNSPGTYVVCQTLSVFDQNQQLACQSITCDTIVVGAPGPFCQSSYIVDTVNSLAGTVYIWNTATPAHNDPAYSTSFQWNFGDGTTSSQPFPTHNYSNAGIYNVCLTITSADSVGNVCSDTYCDTLGMDSIGNLIYKNATGFTLKVLDTSTISVDEQQLVEVQLYPNPADGFVRIGKVEDSRAISWTIRDLKGSIVKSGTTNGNKQIIEVADIRPGLYIISLDQEETPIRHQKLMIER